MIDKEELKQLITHFSFLKSDLCIHDVKAWKIWTENLNELGI